MSILNLFTLSDKLVVSGPENISAELISSLQSYIEILKIQVKNVPLTYPKTKEDYLIYIDLMWQRYVSMGIAEFLDNKWIYNKVDPKTYTGKLENSNYGRLNQCIIGK